jgi:hypothetical protein
LFAAAAATTTAATALLLLFLLQYAAKAVLIQPLSSKPMPIEVELTTRHPCFTCSTCSTQQQQQTATTFERAPAAAAAAAPAAAAAAADDEEEEIQLCPVHVCTVYEMRASDVSKITKVGGQQAQTVHQFNDYRTMGRS